MDKNQEGTDFSRGPLTAKMILSTTWMWTLYHLEMREETENFGKNISPCLTDLLPDSHRHKYLQKHPTSGFPLRSVAKEWKVNSDLRSEKLLGAQNLLSALKLIVAAEHRNRTADLINCNAGA